MRLELESINIKDVQPASQTSIKDGVLSVNISELQELLLQDEKIKTAEVHLVYPGDKTRILNVQDVVQPRCKVDGGVDFPGFLGKAETAGSGKTLSLNGVAVVVSNGSTNRIESGLLDMGGTMAEISPYSHMKNVAIALYAADGIEEREFEDVVKIAGFKTAVYLAKAGIGQPVDEVEVFDSDLNRDKFEGLPRIAYFMLTYSPQFDYLAVSDKVMYGSTITGKFPTIVHPNEVLDGAVVGWNALKGLDTYCFQNNGVIRELYKHHGKDLNFVGVIAATANTDTPSRNRSAEMTAALAKNILGADGIILSKILGGMPHADISMTGVACEKRGVKTAVYTTPLTAIGTLGDTILFNDKELDLIIISGAPFEKTDIYFKADKFIGGTKDTRIYSSEQTFQVAGDEKLRVEQYLTAGVHDHTGGRKLIVKEY